MLVCAILIMNFAFNRVSNTSSQKQKELLLDNVRKSAVQCYALEGKYPEDLQYLKDNYGLHYEIEDYKVHYKNLGDNLLPEINVFYTGE